MQPASVSLAVSARESGLERYAQTDSTAFHHTPPLLHSDSVSKNDQSCYHGGFVCDWQTQRSKRNAKTSNNWRPSRHSRRPGTHWLPARSLPPQASRTRRRKHDKSRKGHDKIRLSNMEPIHHSKDSHRCASSPGIQAKQLRRVQRKPHPRE